MHAELIIYSINIFSNIGLMARLSNKLPNGNVDCLKRLNKYLYYNLAHLFLATSVFKLAKHVRCGLN